VDTHQQRNKICYDLIYQFIDTNLKVKADVIVDCPYRDHNDLDKFSGFVTNRDGILKSVLCACNNEKLWQQDLMNVQSTLNPIN
jgi:hypothetical protein